MNRASTTALLAILFNVVFVSEAADGLAGSAWRLVRIMSMDDRVYVPDDPAKYTLELLPDGRASVQADCNRGNGAWTSETVGQLRFGPVASTRAQCPPGSLSERYLAQFEWVRSYQINNGHLFLATMADGSIVEFEPTGNAPPVATVLGEGLRTKDATELQEAILTRLFDRFAVAEGIEVIAEEVDAYVENMRRGMAELGLTAENDLNPEETAELATMRRAMARAIVRQWKINRKLYGRYGGRIIYQQLGPEPLDAYNEFLQEQQRNGAFTIQDPALAEAFWRYFTDESMHDFMAPGSDDEARAFTMPPWERKP